MNLKKLNKSVLATQLLFLIWIIFIIFILILNNGATKDLLLYVGPQVLLFISSFFFLRGTGVLLLTEALIIGVLVFPLSCYGLFALVQCLLLIAGPPLLFGAIFLAQGKKLIRSAESAQNIINP